jgi:hypothetical protein
VFGCIHFMSFGNIGGDGNRRSSDLIPKAKVATEFFGSFRFAVYAYRKIFRFLPNVQ